MNRILKYLLSVLLIVAAVLGGLIVKHFTSTPKTKPEVSEDYEEPYDEETPDTEKYTYTTNVNNLKVQPYYYLNMVDKDFDEDDIYYLPYEYITNYTADGFNDEDFKYDDFKSNGFVSEDYQELVDGRNEVENYQIQDNYFIYKGQVGIIRNDDGTYRIKPIYDGAEATYFNVDIGIHYFSILSSDNDVTAINQDLYDAAFEDFEMYKHLSSDSVKQMVDDIDNTVYIRYDSYITYNDESKIYTGFIANNGNDVLGTSPRIDGTAYNIDEDAIMNSYSLEFDDISELSTKILDKMSADGNEGEFTLEQINSYMSGTYDYAPIVIMFEDKYEIGFNYGYSGEIEDGSCGFYTVDFTYDELPIYVE